MWGCIECDCTPFPSRSGYFKGYQITFRFYSFFCIYFVNFWKLCIQLASNQDHGQLFRYPTATSWLQWLSVTISLQIFKGCLPQILLVPFLKYFVSDASQNRTCSISKSLVMKSFFLLTTNLMSRNAPCLEHYSSVDILQFS